MTHRPCTSGAPCECERLSASLDALREENARLRCELDEARGQA